MKQVLSIVALTALVGCSCTKPAGEAAPKVLGPPKLLDSSGCTKDGDTRVGFLAPQAAEKFPCLPESQTCFQGKWIGPSLYDWCNPNPATPRK